MLIICEAFSVTGVYQQNTNYRDFPSPGYKYRIKTKVDFRHNLHPDQVKILSVLILEKTICKGCISR